MTTDEPFESQLPPRPAEALLIDALPVVAPAAMLCTSLGRGQLAQVAADRWPSTSVRCLFVDLFRAELARAAPVERPANLAIDCAGDFADGEVDLVAMPLSSSGDGELTSDLLQSAHQRLTLGGRLVASTDNSSDTWLEARLRDLFGKVTRHNHATGAVFSAVKESPLKKLKDYSCRFAFRDRSRLLNVVSQPGVFSHRRIDTGARRLIDAMVVKPGQRVFDIGCGWGPVAIAAAACAADVHVLAIDSNVRAVACTQANAQLNELGNVDARLAADGRCDEPESYDLALANPPYYANFRIAELFLSAAHAALRSGGEVLVVTKLRDWYLDNFSRWFDLAEVAEIKGYDILRGRKS